MNQNGLRKNKLSLYIYIYNLLYIKTSECPFLGDKSRSRRGKIVNKFDHGKEKERWTMDFYLLAHHPTME